MKKLPIYKDMKTIGYTALSVLIILAINCIQISSVFKLKTDVLFIFDFVLNAGLFTSLIIIVCSIAMIHICKMQADGILDVCGKGIKVSIGIVLGFITFILLLNFRFPLVNIDGTAYTSFQNHYNYFNETGDYYFLSAILLDGNYVLYFMFQLSLIAIVSYFWASITYIIYKMTCKKIFALFLPHIIFRIEDVLFYPIESIKLINRTKVIMWGNFNVGGGIVTNLLYAIIFLVVPSTIGVYTLHKCYQQEYVKKTDRKKSNYGIDLITFIVTIFIICQFVLPINNEIIAYIKGFNIWIFPIIFRSSYYFNCLVLMIMASYTYNSNDFNIYKQEKYSNVKKFFIQYFRPFISISIAFIIVIIIACIIYSGHIYMRNTWAPIEQLYSIFTFSTPIESTVLCASFLCISSIILGLLLQFTIILKRAEIGIFVFALLLCEEIIPEEINFVYPFSFENLTHYQWFYVIYLLFITTLLIVAIKILISLDNFYIK